MVPLKIAYVANHACVRCDKEAMPLLEKGHTIHMISHKDPCHWPYYKSRSRYEDLGQLIEAIKIYAPRVDLFHVHNEPSYFVTAIKEITDKPVVLDVHDSFLARMTPEEADKQREDGKYPIRVVAEERNNFQLADALVFPGESFGNLVCNEYKLEQPRLILPSYCTKRMQVYQPQEWWGGLVYEGRIDLPDENAKHSQAYGFRYCEYLDFAKKCQELNLDFHLYARDDKPFRELYEPIAFPHRPVPFEKLLRRISRHDWGLVGNLTSTPEWEVAFPNKMFEYISAGVPVVSLNASDCSDFLVESGLGIKVDSLEELTERWKEHTEVRKHLLKTRQRWTMDEHIHKLEELYAEVLHG